MRSRVAGADCGHLATVTPDGRPHVVVCCFALDGGTLVTAVDHKPKSTTALQRLTNVRARPHASLLVDHYDEDWSALWWVRVDGPARVAEAGAGDDTRARAVELLAAKYPQYRARPPEGPVIVVEVERWRAWP
jgi:PPOX class probable F420-dependent enzyme